MKVLGDESGLRNGGEEQQEVKEDGDSELEVSGRIHVR